MATIAPTSNIRHPSSSQHVTVASLYSWNMSDRASSRDLVDILLQILKCALRCSKPSIIRYAVRVGDHKRTQYFLTLLCRFGLLTETVIKKRSRMRNKRTGGHGTRVIKRYYVTPKGHTLIRIYDTIVEQLVIY